jgi:hypothetical protein
VAEVIEERAMRACLDTAQTRHESQGIERRGSSAVPILYSTSLAIRIARTATRTFTMTSIPGSIARFERLFRAAASLDVDKSDLKRHEEFVHRKIYDLLLRGQAIAKANARDVMQPFDVPITKGLQERIHEFHELNEQIELRPILEAMTKWPPLDLAYSEELEATLPEIAGGLTVALAHSFKVIDPKLKNPQTPHWERAFELFDLLL